MELTPSPGYFGDSVALRGENLSTRLGNSENQTNGASPSLVRALALSRPLKIRVIPETRTSPIYDFLSQENGVSG